jgi:ribosomal protein S18 acetylase RimI-like enzyme
MMLQPTMAETACLSLLMVNESLVRGILVLRTPEGEIVRMSVHREYRRLGIAKRLLIALVGRAAECGLDRVVGETNAKWKEARKLYEGSGFTRTHTRAGPIGREVFYGLVI